jgi:Arc/MetJ-type ribon-helix-helix transcriptional regulator
MKTITVKLPRPLAERLGRAVVRRRSSRSAVVREAIEAHLAAEAGATEGSCFDLASDLAGAVRGPSDLSSNRRRLRGYGR